MRTINLIVIHCSATEQGQDYSVDTIRSWHKKRGFKDIGYHFVIHLDGSIEAGRGVEEMGAHAKGYNANSIGICYIGGVKSKKPYDTRTEAQIHALRRIVETLQIIYPRSAVVGHRDLSVDLNGDGVVSKNEWMKSCPSFEVKTEL
jgi:N-acetyl-anhydromuramyl-L-alanine amidase AmpD